MAAKEKSEFFELFRQPGSTARPSRPQTVKKRSTGPKAPPEQSRTFQVGVSPELAIIASLIMVALLVVSHVWGYRRGRAAGQEMAQAPDTAGRYVGADGGDVGGRTTGGSGTELSMTNGRQIRAPFYTVRIIGGIRLAAARQIRDDLRDRNYRAFVYKPSRESGYAVMAGVFEDGDDLRLTQLRDELISMEYQGSRRFETAYKTQVQDERGIVQ